MATALDIVTGAMEDRRVIGPGKSPTSRELTYGLSRLNQMLVAWRIDGIDFGHVTLASGDTIDVPDDHIHTIQLNLARRLTTFGGQMDPDDVRAAEAGLMALKAVYLNIADLGSEHPLSSSNLANEN